MEAQRGRKSSKALAGNGQACPCGRQGLPGDLSAWPSGLQYEGHPTQNHLAPCPVVPPAGPLLPLSIEPLREESLPRQTSWVNVAFLSTPQ